MRAWLHAEKFWARVDMTSGSDACWPWTGARNKDGYGKARLGKVQLAHTVALIHASGPRPAGMETRHACDNPCCCNPNHLSWGSRQDNVDDKVARGRQSRLSGADHPSVKLTEAQVIEIRQRYVPRHYLHGAQALAREFGVTPSPIRRIVNGHGWL